MSVVLWGSPLQRSLAHANIVVDGNSISAWTDGTAAGTWTDRLKLMAPYNTGNCKLTNVAIPGRSTATLAGEAPGKVDPLWLPGRLNISVIWEGVNDVGNSGGNALAMGNNLKNYCLARKASGWKTVVFGLQGVRVAAGGVVNQSIFDAARGTLNLWLGQYWPTFSDAYVDPSASTKLNRALVADVPDGVHPSSATLNDILPLIDIALRSIDLA